VAHHPSPWIVRFAPLVPQPGPVLDVACGGGRHTRLFVERGHEVVALDRDPSGVADLRSDPRVEIRTADLEDGTPFPLGARQFAAVVVTNYLYRPILDDLVRAVAPNGLFLYETFAQGNERIGHPTNPDYLLQPGELLEKVRDTLRVVAYEDIEVTEPRPAMIQHIAAVRAVASSADADMRG
jgi:SAM-dependent methyltransferase